MFNLENRFKIFGCCLYFRNSFEVWRLQIACLFALQKQKTSKVMFFHIWYMLQHKKQIKIQNKNFICRTCKMTCAKFRTLNLQTHTKKSQICQNIFYTPFLNLLRFLDKWWTLNNIRNYWKKTKYWKHFICLK